MDPLTLIGAVILGGILISAGVHFVSVGGAPAAMAQATGVGTGTPMLAAGAGMTGLITAAAMTGQPLGFILAAGAVGAMLMLNITMLVSNLIYVFGVGTIPVSAKVDRDPITRLEQKSYVTPGTEGHGLPTVCVVSGTIGSALGGTGGGLVYWALQQALLQSYGMIGASTLAGIFAVGVFFINAVIASYNIGGTIEGFHDPKFKRIGRAILASLVASLVAGIFSTLLIGGVF